MNLETFSAAFDLENIEQGHRYDLLYYRNDNTSLIVTRCSAPGYQINGPSFYPPLSPHLVLFVLRLYYQIVLVCYLAKGLLRTTTFIFCRLCSHICHLNSNTIIYYLSLNVKVVNPE